MAKPRRPDVLARYALLVPVAEEKIKIETARIERRRAAMLAVNAGCTVSEVATAAGVARSTVYGWLNGKGRR